MKLRNVRTVDTGILGTYVRKKNEERPRYSPIVRRFLLLFLAVLVFHYYRRSLVTPDALWEHLTAYFLSSVETVRGYDPFRIFLLLAPALAFDSVRYYATNTFAFLRELLDRIFAAPIPDHPGAPLVSVILPAFNEGTNIQTTIETIHDSDYTNFEIIVVDDCSTDDTREICEEYQRRGMIKYIRKNARGGKPSSLNYGFQIAKGEIIAHLDAEVVLYRTALREALKYFRDPKVGAVSGNLRVNNDRVNLLTMLQALEYGITISLQRRWLAASETLEIVSGAFGLFRRELIEQLKGMDPETGDDLDLTLKIRKAGYKIAFAPRAIAMTNVPETLFRLFKQRIRWDECYIRLNIRKHGNIANTRIFDPTNFVATISDMIFNIGLLVIFPVYIVLVAILVPHLLPFILVVTYIFYAVMDVWQTVMVVMLSDKKPHDSIFILCAPLLFFYTFFLRCVRMIAYFLETFHLTYLRDGFFPKKIWDSMPRY